jgi:hypothetical protein
MKRLGVNKLFSEKRWIKGIIEIAQELFIVLLILYLLLLLVETIFAGSVTPHFNLNYLLGLVIVVGIVAALTRSLPAEHREERAFTTKDFLIIASVAIAGALITGYKTSEIGGLSYVISGLVGGLIALLSLLLQGIDIKMPGGDTLAKIGSVVESSYLQLSAIFALLVLLKVLDILPLRINYPLLAYILPLFALPALFKLKLARERIIPGIPLLLVGISIVALLVRLLPYTRSGVPLGYDAGLYKYTIELYAAALPGIPESSLPEWVKGTFFQGLPVLTDVLHLLPGFDTTQLFQGLFPFLSAFLAVPVFILTRKLFGERAGLIAALLYAASYTQYYAFTFFYFKNMLGLLFLLLAIYALEGKKYALLALMYAGLGIFHRPEFLLFSLILIPYFIKNRDRRLLLSALGTAILIIPFWLPRFDINLSTLSGAVGVRGAFFDFGRYQQVALAYLPFAFMGFLYLLIKRNWNSIVFYFLINLGIVIFQLLFFNRFIVSLDLAVVILAAVGLDSTLLNIKGILKGIGVAVAGLLIVSSGILTVEAMREAKPLIDEEQLKAIEWIAGNTEEDAYVVATSYDAPWVLGWSNRKVIAPGLFEWSKHNKEEWLRFLRTESQDTAERFLDKYEGSIYIYYSKNPGNYLELEKFSNQRFQVVYEREAIVYRYLRAGS